MTHPNEFESFINRLKNQKLVVTYVFVFYYTPLTTLRAVPLFVYQSNKGNADEKMDYLLLKIEEELEKEDLHVVARAFDTDPVYFKYAGETMLNIRNLMLELKLNNNPILKKYIIVTHSNSGENIVSYSETIHCDMSCGIGVEVFQLYA